uniref:G-protein coupled receptors family 1 profile domain-containing protein n=1 Tax=Plectus sambesii TaxID=2011161 RepID=A0A914W0M4_9BILA
MLCNGTHRVDFTKVQLGWLYITIASLLLIPYVPCLVAIFRPPLIQKSCFKIMFAMGVLDIVNLIFSAYIPAFYSICDARSCSHNSELKVTGAIAIGCWAAYCAMCVSLAINRMANLFSHSLSASMFGGGRVFVWIFGSYLWGATYVFLFLSPIATVTYDSTLGFYVFNSHEHSAQRSLNLHSLNNLISACLLILCYSTIVVLLKRGRELRAAVNKMSTTSRRERLVLLQSFLICVVTGTTAIGYTIMPRITSCVLLFQLMNILWISAHGTNSIIYLTLNRTIRNRVIAMICRRSFDSAPSNTANNPVKSVNSRSQLYELVPSTAPRRSNSIVSTNSSL